MRKGGRSRKRKWRVGEGKEVEEREEKEREEKEERPEKRLSQ